MPLDPINSAQNPKIKTIRALLGQSKARRKSKQVVLEGRRLIDDVIAQGYTPNFQLYRADQVYDAPYSYPVDPALFNELSDTDQSQGVLAVFEQPHLTIGTNANFVVALDGVRDPGNMGTIIRTAAAAGVDAILLLPNCVDPYNPKVVRAGMGTHFRIPIIPTHWNAIDEQYNGWQLLSADVNPPNTPLYHLDWKRPNVLIIGNEAHGISDDAHQRVTQRVVIPMQNDIESLNTAVAAALLIYKAKRWVLKKKI